VAHIVQSLIKSNDYQNVIRVSNFSIFRALIGSWLQEFL